MSAWYFAVVQQQGLLQQPDANVLQHCTLSQSDQDHSMTRYVEELHVVLVIMQIGII